MNHRMKAQVSLTAPTTDAPDVYVEGTWHCPCGSFTFGPFRSTVPGTTARAECPNCGTTAEVIG